MLTGVSVSCFLMSYLVVLGMEGARLFLKYPARHVFLIGMLIAGFIAHSIFLINELNSSQTLVGSWFHWTVLGAWGLAGGCLYLTIRNPERSTGLILIPIILGLIGVAQWVREIPPFQLQTTVVVWRTIHGISLLMVAIAICFGAGTAVMYLLQSWRLKNRKLKREFLKLPALERSQALTRSCLYLTSLMLAIGLISGIILNVNSQSGSLLLNSSVILTFVLFLVSLVASFLELSSDSSLGGRRGAYLAIANLGFFLLVFVLILLSSHGQSASAQKPENKGSVSTRPYPIVSEGRG